MYVFCYFYLWDGSLGSRTKRRKMHRPPDVVRVSCHRGAEVGAGCRGRTCRATMGLPSAGERLPTWPHNLGLNRPML